MPTPALYALVDGFVMAPTRLLATALVLIAVVLVAALVLPFFAADRGARKRPPRPTLRLVPTANAWGYSDRATLDESAVGL